MPLAIAPELQSEPESFAFAPGSLMVLLTDGFYEAADPAGEQFGEERVAEFVRRHARVPLADLVQRLHAEVERFTQGAPQADDLTAILVRRQP
jgi:phosphoserine phosphatase